MAFFNFKTITDTVSKGFDWLEKHPNTAAALGGAAGAGLNYLSARQSAREARKARKEERAYRSTFGGASTLDENEYGRGLDIADPTQGIAASTGEIAPMGQVGTVGQPRSMATALQLRNARQRG